MSRYKNIDFFYGENKELLLESDDYRLCKSIPRNVEDYVSKFVHYYENHKEKGRKCVVSKEIMTKQILGKEEWKDTDNTAKRIMEEIGFLEVNGDEFTFTPTFETFYEEGANFPVFLMERLDGISSMKNMTMYYNSIISALREGYIYGDIMDFPDSKEKFKKAVTNPYDRRNFKQRVYEVYGFSGRYHNVDDDYTPNANYRILTTLRILGFIEQTPSDFENIRMYKLTPSAFTYLDRLNANLGEISDEEFEVLIEKENDYESKLKKLAKKYGVEGTTIVTHETRLPQVQEIFKERLIKKYGQKCMMCDVTHNEILVASHIRRASEENIFGKADYNNGFLLCAMHDKLFDRYLISFNCFTGKIMISTSLSDKEKELLGLDDDFCLDKEYMTKDRIDYLVDHNQKFIEKESERQ